MWHADFIARCLASDSVVNDAAGYGVTILPAIHWPGDVYWRCIGIHHLTGPQNVGKNHLFLDALNEAGQRVSGTRVTWGWEGMTPDEIQRTQPAIIDKPANEPGGNIGLYAGQVVWAQVAGALSDRVIGVHTGHDDEPGGNTRFHHSFYAVWQLTAATGQQPPIEPPVTAHEIVIRIGDQAIHTADTTVVLQLGSVQVVKVANQEIETGREDIVITIEVVAL